MAAGTRNVPGHTSLRLRFVGPGLCRTPLRRADAPGDSICCVGRLGVGSEVSGASCTGAVTAQVTLVEPVDDVAGFVDGRGLLSEGATADSSPFSTAPDPGCERLIPERGPEMAVTTVYVSRHDQRVRLVADALTKNSKLTDKAAVELAKHVLDALDHIPEKVR